MYLSWYLIRQLFHGLRVLFWVGCAVVPHRYIFHVADTFPFYSFTDNKKRFVTASVLNGIENGLLIMTIHLNSFPTKFTYFGINRVKNYLCCLKNKI